MAKTQATDTPVTPSANPIVLVGLGPQNSGKSTVLRAIIYRAIEAGRAPRICDGDRNDAYLTGMFGRELPDGTFEGVSRPPYADDASVIDWLDGELAHVDSTRQSVVLDMGGGDLVLPTYARDRDMVEMLAGARIRPVALHMILPNPSDLAVLEQMEESSAFAPEATILALNAGPMGDTRSPDLVFRRVRQAPAYQRALARGAREILVPTLPCMADVDRAALTFSQAAAKPSPLGLTKGQMVLMFQRKLNTALDTVGDWLV